MSDDNWDKRFWARQDAAMNRGLKDTPRSSCGCLIWPVLLVFLVALICLVGNDATGRF